jgi:hypothetical protein
MARSSPKAELNKSRLRIIACGALAREILALTNNGGQKTALAHIDLACLPAILHNSPEKIPTAIDAAIVKARAEGFEQIFIAYADCGTGGLLDQVCEKHGVERIAGPHCFSFYFGNDAFLARDEDDIYTFFLTDFLARQFRAFVIEPLGLDKHPELRDMYFGHYKKLVYLVQEEDAALDKAAENAAEFLDLEYERRITGYGDLTGAIDALTSTK